MVVVGVFLRGVVIVLLLLDLLHAVPTDRAGLVRDSARDVDDAADGAAAVGF